MTTNYPSLKTLVEEMEGYRSTNDWDVVCSYSVSMLNALLKSQYDAGKLAKEMNIFTERTNTFTDEQFTIAYSIKFASPSLAFKAGSSGYAILTMPIVEGSYYTVTPNGAIAPTPKKQIPGGKYSVQAEVPFAAINGDTGEITEQGKIVTFSDGNRHDNHIIIHFGSELGTKYTIYPNPDPKDHDILVTYFLPVLQYYFQNEIKEVDYVLSSINNKASSSGSTNLTPKSFVFASAGEADHGHLSLYIQTKESGNRPGDLLPSFQPKDFVMYPIPEDYSASIILSNSLITQAYLAPQLKASGFGTEFFAPSAGGGVGIKLTKNQNIIAAGDEGFSISGVCVPEYITEHKYEGLHINLKDNPIKMLIQQGQTSEQSQISLQFTGKTTSSWRESFTVIGFGPMDTHGSVDITVSLNKEHIPMILSTDDVIESSIAVHCSEFKVSTKPQSCRGCSKSTPYFYTNELQSRLQFPSIEINLTGLNFFNTTNLLAPGQKMIKLDTTKGVQTPCDFLVVGNVAQKVDDRSKFMHR